MAIGYWPWARTGWVFGRLRDLELEDSRANAALLAEAMSRVRPRAGRAELEATAFLIMHLGEATMRLAVSVGRREGDRLVASYKRMVLRELAPERAGARLRKPGRRTRS